MGDSQDLKKATPVFLGQLLWVFSCGPLALAWGLGKARGSEGRYLSLNELGTQPLNPSNFT